MTALWSRLRRFARDSRAVAAVEFALILPFLLVLYVGSAEVSDFITVDRRVNTISGTIGDLVARADRKISIEQLEDYLTIGDLMLGAQSSASLEVVISCVEILENGKTNVLWSEGFNGGSPHPENKPYAPLAAGASTLNDIARGNFVIVSEARYVYQPVFGFRMNEAFSFSQDLTAINLYHVNYYLSRFGTAIDLVS